MSEDAGDVDETAIVDDALLLNQVRFPTKPLCLKKKQKTILRTSRCENSGIENALLLVSISSSRYDFGGSYMQVIPMSEVAKHDKDGDAWTVVHRKVLDISEFIPRHPGGKAVLKQYAGKVRQSFHCLVKATCLP